MNDAPLSSDFENSLENIQNGTLANCHSYYFISDRLKYTLTNHELLEKLDFWLKLTEFDYNLLLWVLFWMSYSKVKNSMSLTTQISNLMKFEFNSWYFLETWTRWNLQYLKYSSQNSANSSVKSSLNSKN